MIFIDILGEQLWIGCTSRQTMRGASKQNLVMFESRVNFQGSKQFLQSLGRINSKKSFTPWQSMRPMYLSQTKIAKPLPKPASCATKALMWGP
jgi:hypothetical protein